jgi:glycerophosphoryl diester phosphodiesterase
MTISSNSRNKPRRGPGWLGLIIALPVLYYGTQVLLRSASAGRVQVIAHRGGPGRPAYAPENTLAAFRHGIQMGADWLEFDVQMTKDGTLVVMHDDTVDRTTNGTGRVADLTLDEIRSLDAGQAEKVPTFQEVLDLAKSNGANIFAETKSAHLYPGIEAKMLAALEGADYLDRTIIQSFEADSLNTLHRLNPKARLCALSGLWQFGVKAPAGDAKYVCPMAEMAVLDPYMIRQAHDDGRQVIVWFAALQNTWLIRFVEFFGVDGIIVDDPALVQQTLR